MKQNFELEGLIRAYFTSEIEKNNSELRMHEVQTSYNKAITDVGMIDDIFGINKTPMLREIELQAAKKDYAASVIKYNKSKILIANCLRRHCLDKYEFKIEKSEDSKNEIIGTYLFSLHPPINKLDVTKTS